MIHREKEDLIYRRGDPQDRRKTLISLTESGRDYRNWLIGEIRAMISQILERFNEEEISNYEENLKNLIELIKKLDERS